MASKEMDIYSLKLKMNYQNIKKNIASQTISAYILTSTPAKPLLESLILAGFIVFRGHNGIH